MISRVTAGLGCAVSALVGHTAFEIFGKPAMAAAEPVWDCFFVALLVAGLTLAASGWSSVHGRGKR